MLSPRLFQMIFDYAFVVRIGELRVAAQRSVLVDPLWIVGVVAVGSPTGGHDQMIHPAVERGVDHVASPLDVDRVEEFPRVM